MEDLGNILFYIIAAIIAIFGALANKKKKAAQKPFPQTDIPEQKEEEITFPDIEEKKPATQYEMINPESLNTTDSGFEGTSLQPSVDQRMEMGAEYEGRYSEPLAEEFAAEGISVTEISITDSELGTDSEISLHVKNSWAKNLIDEFDLPKAIVYSEILNRKDFV